MKKIVAGILLAGLISTSVIPVYAQAESPEVVYHYYEAYAGKLPAPDGAGSFHIVPSEPYSLEIASLSSLMRVSMVAKFSSRSWV